jgi:hypothetical protein
LAHCRWADSRRGLTDKRESSLQGSFNSAARAGFLPSHGRAEIAQQRGSIGSGDEGRAFDDREILKYRHRHDFSSANLSRIASPCNAQNGETIGEIFYGCFNEGLGRANECVKLTERDAGPVPRRPGEKSSEPKNISLRPRLPSS